MQKKGNKKGGQIRMGLNIKVLFKSKGLISK